MFHNLSTKFLELFLYLNSKELTKQCYKNLLDNTIIVFDHTKYRFLIFWKKSVYIIWSKYDESYLKILLHVPIIRYYLTSC